jgi:hypothetical protein
VYILAVVEEDMIFDIDPLCDMEKQSLVQPFIHILFISSVTTGGQDDR